MANITRFDPFSDSFEDMFRRMLRPMRWEGEAAAPEIKVDVEENDKAYVVFTANRLAIAGLAFLGLGMAGAVLLVSDFLFGAVAAIVATAAVAAGVAWLWFGSPLVREVGNLGDD